MVYSIRSTKVALLLLKTTRKIIQINLHSINIYKLLTNKNIKKCDTHYINVRSSSGRF